MSNTLAAYKGRLSSTANPNINQGINLFYDFDDLGSFTTQTTGSGAAINSGLQNASFSYFGQVSLSGAYNGDEVSIKTDFISLPSFASLDLQTLVYPEGTSSLTSTKYIFSFGIGQSGFYPSNGGKNQISIGFDPDTSANWICAYSSVSGTFQTQITTVPVTTAATLLRINANQSACYFYINNVLVASILHGLSEFSTNPFYANALAYNYFRKLGNNPSATPAVRIDSLKLSGTYLTPREFVNV